MVTPVLWVFDARDHDFEKKNWKKYAVGHVIWKTESFEFLHETTIVSGVSRNLIRMVALNILDHLNSLNERLYLWCYPFDRGPSYKKDLVVFWT
jgi:alkyl sulfatase BDS1-like metallo-beta-lactamase superfamily hydrolase